MSVGKKRKINVLSLFGGIECGRVALDRENIDINKYYSSEICKDAIKVADGNYSDIVQLGDITKWKEWDIDWGSINLLLAGFPCQSWSLAGKQKGILDERGKLVYCMIDILSEIRKTSSSKPGELSSSPLISKFVFSISASKLYQVPPSLIIRKYWI